MWKRDVMVGWRLREKERESVREMKGLVTGGGGLCVVRYVVLWQAVIKSSPGLTARHLFTEDFNFPDSPFPLPITPSPRSHTPPRFLSSVTFVLPCSLSLCLAPVTQSLNPVRTSNKKLSAAAQLPIFFCTNPFVLSSFIFVYLHRPEGKELLEHLGNVVCDFLNLARG